VKTLLFILGSIGVVIAGLGGLTIHQYLSGHPDYSAWTGVVPMASPTAVGFFLTGLSLLVINVLLNVLFKAVFARKTDKEILNQNVKR
jgi:hypothetical protein